MKFYVEKYMKNFNYSIVNVKIIIFYLLFSLVVLSISNVLPMIASALNVVFVSISLIYFSTKSSFDKNLLYTSVLLIPESFMVISDIIPFSFFHLLIILQTLIAIKHKKNRNLIFILAFICFSCFCDTYQTLNLNINGIKQFLMIILFFFTFICCDYYKSRFDRKDLDSLIAIYLLSCLGCATQVCFQSFIFKNFGIPIGYYDEFFNRTAFGGLMTDYSFASLYIASGAFVCFINIIKKDDNVYKSLFLFVILLFSCILVSARTGLFAFIVSSSIYFLFHIRKTYKTILIFILYFTLIIIALYNMSSKRGEQSLIDSSARFQVYEECLTYISENPICGIGLGLKNIQNITNFIIPHNFFLQYLLQIGILGTMLIVLPFVNFICCNIKNVNNYKWLPLICFFGSMVIPDIICSRFLFAIMVIASIDEKRIFHINYTQHLNWSLYDGKE